MATKMAKKFTANAVLNARIRNKLRSIIGSSSRCWRRTHNAVIARRATIAMIGVAERPDCARSFKPKMHARTAATDIAALTMSSRPAFGSRYSGSTRGPRMSRAAMTGNASRNTEPHQKNSSITPPRTGPIALPAEKAPIHTRPRTPVIVGSRWG